MNIFYLHNDTKICAELHVDKHVVKMIVEYAQLLSTAKRMIDGVKYQALSKTGRKVQRYRLPNPNEEATVYKAVHYHHPSAVWARSSTQHYNWLYNLFRELGKEYTHRYKRDHSTIELLKELLKNPPDNAPLNKIGTLPTPAMPDECIVPGDSVASYRKYYIMKKVRFATWKAPSKMPDWFKQGVENVNNI